MHERRLSAFIGKRNKIRVLILPVWYIKNLQNATIKRKREGELFRFCQEAEAVFFVNRLHPLEIENVTFHNRQTGPNRKVLGTAFQNLLR